jgi:Domain of unknown function (DUF2427)
MFSIAKSRYTLLLQFVFFVLHTVGVFVGTLYNANTPDLYENNAHHKMGWVFTWFSLAWVLIGIINTYAVKSPSIKSIFGIRKASYQKLSEDEDGQGRRWSGDSGNESGTSPSSERGPPSFSGELSQFARNEEDEEDEKRIFRNTKVDKFLLHYVRKHAVGTPLLLLRIVHGIFERTLPLLGFASLCTGFITLAGIFVSYEP